MSSAPVPIHLADHEKVITAFGYWPLFHDAEVRSLTLDRNQILFGKIYNARIYLTIHALEWTEAKGEAKPSFNHHLVHFEFEEVEDVNLSGFNHQNALLGLFFNQAPSLPNRDSRHRVSLDAAHGLGGNFTYSRGRIVSVIPCSDLGSPRY